jgi:hypothetical protein
MGFLDVLGALTDAAIDIADELAKDKPNDIKAWGSEMLQIGAVRLKQRKKEKDCILTIKAKAVDSDEN